MGFCTSRIYLFATVVMATLITGQCADSTEDLGICGNGVPPVELKVGYTEQFLYSDNYPLSPGYIPCKEYVFRAEPFRRPDDAIQLTLLDYDDHIIVSAITKEQTYAGILSFSASSIHTIGSNVTFLISTNKWAPSRGFALSYSIVNVAANSSSCGQDVPVYVGRSPLYQSFNPFTSQNIDRCNWRLEAIDENGDLDSDTNSTIVIEMLTIDENSKYACSSGDFSVYDGQNASSAKVLSFCSHEQFSKLYMSSHYATLTHAPTTKDADITFALKMYTRDKYWDFEKDSKQNIILTKISLTIAPVYFTLPLYANVNGTITPLQVNVMNPDIKYANLETELIFPSGQVAVIGVDDRSPSCLDNVIQVDSLTAPISNNVTEICSRGVYPTYILDEFTFNQMVINTGSGTFSKIYIKATVVKNAFSSHSDVELTAYKFFLKDLKMPKVPPQDLPYAPNNYIGRRVITKNKAEDLIVLNVDWEVPSSQSYLYNNVDPNLWHKDYCPGDFISVYDGEDESAPVLFSTCDPLIKSGKVSQKVVGSASADSMLVLFNADDNHRSKVAQLEYYTVTSDIFSHCNLNIKVDSEGRELTSPGFPDTYPLDVACTYNVSTMKPGDVLVVATESINFDDDCSKTLLTVTNVILFDDYVAPTTTICGYKTTVQQYVIGGDKTVITFVSGKDGSNYGGWKLRLFSRPPGYSGNSGCVNYASWAFGVLALVIIQLIKLFMLA